MMRYANRAAASVALLTKTEPKRVRRNLATIREANARAEAMRDERALADRHRDSPALQRICDALDAAPFAIVDRPVALDRELTAATFGLRRSCGDRIYADVPLTALVGLFHRATTWRSLLNVLYLALFLRDSAPAALDGCRRAEVALDDCIRRAERGEPWCLADDERQALKQLVVTHDAQLAAAPAHRYVGTGAACHGVRRPLADPCRGLTREYSHHVFYL